MKQKYKDVAIFLTIVIVISTLFIIADNIYKIAPREEKSWVCDKVTFNRTFTLEPEERIDLMGTCPFEIEEEVLEGFDEMDFFCWRYYKKYYPGVDWDPPIACFDQVRTGFNSPLCVYIERFGYACEHKFLLNDCEDTQTVWLWGHFDWNCRWE